MALYEKFWDCPACGNRGISALRKQKCPQCGHTKTRQDQEHRSQIEITDPDGIELAMGSPHWTCSSCGSVNLDKYHKCQGCGNSRDTSDGTNQVIELGTTPPPSYTPPKPYDEYLSAQPDEQVTPTEIVTDSLAYHEETSSRSWYQDLKEHDWRQLPDLPWKPILIGLLIIGVLFGLGWMIFHTTSVEGQVIGFFWVRVVQIERYQTIHDSGWSYPAGAYNISSSSRIRSYEPIYETRTKTVHHSETCYRDRGNGSEESYDCSYDSTETYQEKVGDRPIWDTWYEYNLDTWRYERTARAEGKDHTPYWPQYTLTHNGRTVIGAERVGSTPQTYTIYFRTIVNDKTAEYAFNTSEPDWNQYMLSEKYPLKINHFNAIMNNPLQDKEANKK